MEYLPVLKLMLNRQRKESPAVQRTFAAVDSGSSRERVCASSVNPANIVTGFPVGAGTAVRGISSSGLDGDGEGDGEVSILSVFAQPTSPSAAQRIRYAVFLIIQSIKSGVKRIERIRFRGRGVEGPREGRTGSERIPAALVREFQDGRIESLRQSHRVRELLSALQVLTVEGEGVGRIRPAAD